MGDLCAEGIFLRCGERSGNKVRPFSLEMACFCIFGSYKTYHWRRQGGAGGPGPLNGRAKKKGRGYFYQMSNMYTCIAYLLEIRKFCSKNLVHKGVNFEAKML